MYSFKIEYNLTDTIHAKISLSGAINENFKYDDVDVITQPNVQIDFQEVVLINSCGVRELINFIKNFENQNLIYINCPRVIMNQFNSVKGLVPKNSKIKSFYAPYYGAISDSEMDIKLYAHEIISCKAPKKTNLDTGEELIFEEVEEIYFRFIKEDQT